MLHKRPIERGAYRQATMRSVRCLGPKYWYCASASHTTLRNFSLLTVTVDRFFCGLGLTLNPLESYSLGSFAPISAKGARPRNRSLLGFTGGISLLITSKTRSLICQARIPIMISYNTKYPSAIEPRHFESRCTFENIKNGAQVKNK
jgi:hypothetical protein